jgi:hypothetical protein
MVIRAETHFPHVRLMTFLLPADGLDAKLPANPTLEEPDAATSLHYY